MKNYRRWFQLFVLLTVIGFSSFGCVTKQVRSASSHIKPKAVKLAFDKIEPTVSQHKIP